MDRDEIENMPAGKKMNQLIWWKIFDMTPAPLNDDRGFLPDYSGEIAPAWSVVEKLEADSRELLFKITRKGFGMNTLHWAAEFRQCSGGQNYYYVEAESAPLAIARAALLVVSSI
jgi:hypothetical protein